MDFIERIFGVSPDMGDGSTEMLYLAALVIILAAAVYYRRQKQRPH
jgi:hypothetical protein